MKLFKTIKDILLDETSMRFVDDTADFVETKVDYEVSVVDTENQSNDERVVTDLNTETNTETVTTYINAGDNSPQIAVIEHDREISTKHQEVEYAETSLQTRAPTRATIDVEHSVVNDFAWLEPGDNDDWKLTTIEEENIPKLKAKDLVKMLVNASPDVDRALHDFLTYCNSNWMLRGETDEAQRILDNFLRRLEDTGTPLNVKIEQSLSGAFLTGAFFWELVLDEDGREAVDMAVVDPLMVRYRRATDPVRGQYWQKGQIIEGVFTPLEDPTIIYSPVNPIPDNPFGRPLISSAIFSVVFQLGLLKSTRQVVETQAWPKGIWSVDRKLLFDTEVPPDKIDAHVEATKKMLKNVWDNIKKTESPIVGSEASYEVVSAMNTSSLSGVDMLERTLERWIIRALKTHPVLFGSDQSISEATADIQLLGHGIFINSVQVTLETLLTRLFTLVLRAQGDPTTPIFKFDRINAAERKREAEIMRSQLQAYTIGVNSMLITPQEARADFERSNVDIELTDDDLIDQLFDAFIAGKENAALPPANSSTGSSADPVNAPQR